MTVSANESGDQETKAYPLRAMTFRVVDGKAALDPDSVQTIGSIVLEQPARKEIEDHDDNRNK